MRTVSAPRSIRQAVCRVAARKRLRTGHRGLDCGPRKANVEPGAFDQSLVIPQHPALTVLHDRVASPQYRKRTHQLQRLVLRPQPLIGRLHLPPGRLNQPAAQCIEAGARRRDRGRP